LIKEVEGLLGQEDEDFVICRPSGYGVTSRTSTGLEPANVGLWMPKAFTVAYVPSAFTKVNKGQTVTEFSDDLKLLLLDIDVASEKGIEPRVAAGCLHDIKDMRTYDKFERLMGSFSYNRKKIFAGLPTLDWADSYFSFKGDFSIEPLFGINDSDTVVEKLVAPMLGKYRAV
jgi:hypothetical protein